MIRSVINFPQERCIILFPTYSIQLCAFDDLQKPVYKKKKLKKIGKFDIISQVSLVKLSLIGV